MVGAPRAAVAGPRLSPTCPTPTPGWWAAAHVPRSACPTAFPPRRWECTTRTPTPPCCCWQPPTLFLPTGDGDYRDWGNTLRQWRVEKPWAAAFLRQWGVAMRSVAEALHQWGVEKRWVAAALRKSESRILIERFSNWFFLSISVSLFVIVKL